MVSCCFSGHDYFDCNTVATDLSSSSSWRTLNGLCVDSDVDSTVTVSLLEPNITSVKEALLQKSSLLLCGDSSTALMKSGSVCFLLATLRESDFVFFGLS